jgi:hypothetical protein
VEQMTAEPVGNRNVVVGVYRDGDNSLDAVQERNVTDFIKTTATNSSLKVVAEDTTRVVHPPFVRGQLLTEWSTIQNGTQHITRITAPADMSNRKSLAVFVEQMLEARASDPKFRSADVWLDLVDHGGGYGGGLQADSSGGFMSLQDVAGAISDGRAAFRKKFLGADDSVTGVLANQCLTATIRGMVRFDHSAEMPWHADRPAIASYQAIADDGRLPEHLREAAAHAAAAVNYLVLAHKESTNFGPFHPSYADAIGPTVHLPITKQLYDSWADQSVLEMHNDFFDAVHGREFARDWLLQPS